jgi:hypothetical protein
MIKLLLQRKASKSPYTMGKLLANEELFCDTLENTKKIISAGAYKIALVWSNKFHRVLPELLNVPNRVGIRIHRGNSVKDTQGCILVGINDKAGWLRNSAVYERKIVALIKQYDECWIAVSLKNINMLRNPNSKDVSMHSKTASIYLGFLVTFLFPQ